MICTTQELHQIAMEWQGACVRGFFNIVTGDKGRVVPVQELLGNPFTGSKDM